MGRLGLANALEVASVCLIAAAIAQVAGALTIALQQWSGGGVSSLPFLDLFFSFWSPETPLLAFLALVAGLLGQATRRGAGAPAVVARIVQAAALGVFLLAIGAAVWDLTRIADYGSAGFFVAEAVSNLLVGVGGVALTTVILARPSIRGPGRGETLRDHE